MAFLGDLHAQGVDLYLHIQGIDTTTPGGNALFQMMGVFAEFERAIIQERVCAGLAKAGEPAQRGSELAHFSEKSGGGFLADFGLAAGAKRRLRSCVTTCGNGRWRQSTGLCEPAPATAFSTSWPIGRTRA